MNHTPGPWGCVYTSYHAHDYRLTNIDGTPLNVNATANDHSEQRANARLIAAAPELLDALKAIAAQYSDDPDDLEHFDAAYHIALTAIVKTEDKK